MHWSRAEKIVMARTEALTSLLVVGTCLVRDAGMVPRGRVELPTPAFSGPRSTGELPRHGELILRKSWRSGKSKPLAAQISRHSSRRAIPRTNQMIESPERAFVTSNFGEYISASTRSRDSSVELNLSFCSIERSFVAVFLRMTILVGGSLHRIVEFAHPVFRFQHFAGL